MKTLLYVALALLLGGCFATSAPSDALPLEFRSLPWDQVPSLSVSGGVGSIVVRDRTVTGVCHSREVQEARLEDGVVVLQIAHPRSTTKAVCIALGKLGAYEAIIRGLSAGTYRLRIVYQGEISSDSYPRPSLEQVVEVR